MKNLKNQLKMKCPKVSQIFASGKNLEKSGQIFVLTSIKFYQMSICEICEFHKVAVWKWPIFWSVWTSQNQGFADFGRFSVIFRISADLKTAEILVVFGGPGHLGFGDLGPSDFGKSEFSVKK